jgi:hypothetical protein
MPEREPTSRETLAADLRGPIRKRSGEVVDGKLAFTGSEDKFAFDRSIVPAGWDYQWKAAFIKNAPNTQHMTELAANHWEPVPAERHDGIFMPRGHKGNIERGGMILMERDIRLTMRARAMEKREADDSVNRSRQMAGLLAQNNPSAVDKGVIDFGHGEAQKATGVRIERVPMGDPDRQKGYQYTIDE